MIGKALERERERERERDAMENWSTEEDSARAKGSLVGIANALELPSPVSESYVHADGRYTRHLIFLSITIADVRCFRPHSFSLKSLTSREKLRRAYSIRCIHIYPRGRYLVTCAEARFYTARKFGRASAFSE